MNLIIKFKVPERNPVKQSSRQPDTEERDLREILTEILSLDPSILTQ
jgi:hypothetical protein